MKEILRSEGWGAGGSSGDALLLLFVSLLKFGRFDSENSVCVSLTLFKKEQNQFSEW